MRGFSQIVRHLLLTATLIAAILTTAGGKTLESQQTAIGALTSAPDTFKGRNVVISGILKTVERDYFSAPDFVLTDTSGQAVSVTPWAPLELPPTTSAGGEQPFTMRDFLGRKVAIQGNVRQGPSGAPMLQTVSAIEWSSDRSFEGTLGESHADRESLLSIAGDTLSRNVSPRVLVLMVDFSDRAGVVSRDFFQDLLFGKDPAVSPNGSFRDYYREVSYGQWDITGGVNRPGIAWVRLPQVSHYYSGDCFGIGRGSECPAPQYPQNPQKMIEDAITAARAAGIDFGAYDGNGDGFVDSLFVVHAGRGSELSLDRGDIWSHRGVVPVPMDTNSTNSSGRPVYVRSYTTVPEYWYRPGDMTIGVIAHEYGHDLGLPDLYDLDYDAAGIGNWSLMATGCWNGNLGNTPAQFDAWSKYRLGWVKPRRVFGTLVNQPIAAAATFPDVYQFSESEMPNPVEYFLIENRQRVGFDAALPGSGLLIWHIDENAQDNRNQWYPGCSNCSGHYRVALIQADQKWNLERNQNRGDSGDPFPGICATRTCSVEFTGFSKLNNNLYTGRQGGFSITTISASGPTITATLSAGRNITSPNTSPLEIRSPGTVFLTAGTSTTVASPTWGRLVTEGTSTPFGVEMLQRRENNVLVSEVGFEAAEPVRRGRIPVTIDDAANTGVALVNAHETAAAISFFFTDTGGRDVGHGSLQLPPRSQIARFLTDSPFSAPGTFQGTWTFESDVPVGSLAIRGTTNSRAEFIMTALPVVPLSSELSNASIASHVVDGAGWSTQLLLVNPTDQDLNGTVEFTIDGRTPGGNTYRIAPRSLQVFETSGTAEGLQQGTARVIPIANSPAPAAALIESVQVNGVLVSAAGITRTSRGSAFRVYTESLGDFEKAQPGSSETAIALMNPSESAMTVHLELMQLDGTVAAPSAAVVIAARGHRSFLLRDVQEFSNVTPLQGVLRIWTDSGAGVFVTSFLLRYNERGDFLLTNLPSMNESQLPVSADRIFPELAAGNGLMTRIILLDSGSTTLRLYSQAGEPVGAK